MLFRSLAAVEYLLAGGKSVALNCGYGHGYSVREVIDAAQPISPRPFDVSAGPRRAGDIGSVIADASLLRRLLGWTPKHDSLDEMLRSSIDWELAREPQDGLPVAT